MTGNQYQELAMRTANNLHTLDEALINGAMGLCGETGEVMEIIKKWKFQSKPLDLEDFKLELSDVLWYVALLCQVTNLKMEDVMIANIAKLEKRYAKV